MKPTKAQYDLAYKAAMRPDATEAEKLHFMRLASDACAEDLAPGIIEEPVNLFPFDAPSATMITRYSGGRVVSTETLEDVPPEIPVREYATPRVPDLCPDDHDPDTCPDGCPICMPF